jgi:hypothetical protein
MMGWAASGRFQTILPCKEEFATDFSRQLSKPKIVIASVAKQ